MNMQKYSPWHVTRTEQLEGGVEDEDYSDDDMDQQATVEMNEWELLSQLGLINNLNLNELDVLGRHDFANNHTWENHNVPSNLHDIAVPFLHTSNMSHQDVHSPSPTYHQNYTLSSQQ